MNLLSFRGVLTQRRVGTVEGHLSCLRRLGLVLLAVCAAGLLAAGCGEERLPPVDAGGGAGEGQQASPVLTSASPLPTLTDPAGWYIDSTGADVSAVELSTGRTVVLEHGHGWIGGVVHDGRWLAWLEGKTMAEMPPQQLHVLDLKTGSHRVTGYGSIWNVSISHGLMLWDNEVDADRGQLVITDLSTGETRPVSPSDDSQAGGQISYPWVTWGQGGKETTARWVNLETGESGHVAASDYGSPLLSGDWMVWCDRGSSESSSIKALNLRTGETTRLADRGGRTEQGYDLVVGAPWAAWYDYSSNVLRAANLETGRHVVVTEEFAEEDGLVISGPWIVWHCWRPGGLFAYDTRTGRTQRLAEDSENGPWLYGTWIVWSEAFNQEGPTGFRAHDLVSGEDLAFSF